MVSDIATVVCAVTHVTVDKQIWLPLIPETKPRARFWSVGLHVVAIEILISARRAPTHFSWTILIDAVIGARSFVTVSVVDRNEEQYDIVQYPGGGFCNRDIAQECETCVFAIRLTGVNAGLNQNYGFLLRTRRLRRKHARFRGDQ